MSTTEVYALFSANAYEGPWKSKLKHGIPDSWKRLPIDPLLLDDNVTGLRAHVYHNYGLKELVIAYAGTHRGDKGDLEAIGEILSGRLPKQFQSAFTVYSKVKDYLDEKDVRAQISFTGHSLGGALAQYMAIVAKGCSAETFGAPGILGALEALRNDYIPGYPYPVVNHVARGDLIGYYGHHLGKVDYHIFDATDILPIALPLYIRTQVVLSLASGSYFSHSIERYVTGLRHFHGISCVPTGYVSYRDGKTKQVVNIVNWAGVARKEYI